MTQQSKAANRHAPASGPTKPAALHLAFARGRLEEQLTEAYRLHALVAGAGALAQAHRQAIAEDDLDAFEAFEKSAISSRNRLYRAAVAIDALNSTPDRAEGCAEDELQSAEALASAAHDALGALACFDEAQALQDASYLLEEARARGATLREAISRILVDAEVAP